VLRTVCITTSRNSPRSVRAREAVGGSQWRVGKTRLVSVHSSRAATLAKVYADPLLLKRKEEIDAVLGLYSAVVQNSRKWKMQRKVMKRGARHEGLSVCRKMMEDIVAERTSVIPSRNARRAIPERDFDPEGPYRASCEVRASFKEGSGGGVCGEPRPPPETRSSAVRARERGSFSS